MSLRTRNNSLQPNDAKHSERVQTVISGMRIYYNLLRSHMALNGKTLAEKIRNVKAGALLFLLEPTCFLAEFL